METCENVARYNVADIAGSHSTLTGALAGFAFTALIVLVTSRLQGTVGRTNSFSYAAQLLVAAFVGLTLTSLAYGTLSGELLVKNGEGDEGFGGRAASMELVLGIAFAACAIMLLYALVNLLDEADATSDANVAGEPGHTSALARVARDLRLFAVFFMLPLLAAGLFVSAQDYNAARSGGFSTSQWPGITGLALMVVQLVLGWLWWHRRDRASSPTGHGREQLVETVFAYGMLALVVLIVVAFTGLTAALDTCQSLSPIAVIGFVLLFGVAAAFSAYVLARRRLPTASGD